MKGSGSYQNSVPVIIIGMHRSGTTLLTRLLQHQGMYVGGDIEMNWESRFFLTLNDWLLKQTGSTWDKPGDFDVLLKNAEARELVLYFLERFLRLPRVIRYLGMYRTLRFGSPRRLPGVWGWKDPRNTITLPLWLELFPKARVLCVERNGLDVALSLILRRERDFRRVQQERSWRSLYYSVILKREPLGGSLMLEDLQRCVDLWKFYLLTGRSYRKELGERFLSVRFEELMERPEPVLSRVLSFCGLPAADALWMKRIVIDASRNRAYRGVLDTGRLNDAIRRDLALYESVNVSGSETGSE